MELKDTANNVLPLSFAVMVKDEAVELENLLLSIQEHVEPGDEIVILQDGDDPHVTRVVSKWKEMYNYVVVGNRSLNKDFASQKNALIGMCRNTWIINYDADELPSENSIVNYRRVINANKNSNTLYYRVPRHNEVFGITPAHIVRWHWNMDPKGRINYPDYQTRIFKKGFVKWVGKVHERIVHADVNGVANFASLPANSGFDILHLKDIERQERQNNFYNTIPL